jgi:uncharacterized protein
MYYQVVSQCTQSLKNVEASLDKAEHFAAAKKLDVGVLLNGRLAPDMKPSIYLLDGRLRAGSAECPPMHSSNSC